MQGEKGVLHKMAEQQAGARLRSFNDCPSLLDRSFAGLVGELAEQLRLILEPTLASRLAGDYRTGKRINMKKVRLQGALGRCNMVSTARLFMATSLHGFSWLLPSTLSSPIRPALHQFILHRAFLLPFLAPCSLAVLFNAMFLPSRHRFAAGHWIHC